MMSRLRIVAFAIVACATLTLPRGTISSAEPQSITPSIDRVAEGLPPEVRLRKLHLVRPDLIPYPIAYEVVC